MSRQTADVAIVGGGIVGAACAEAFTREGLKTVLVEENIPAGGATAAGMGHIVVMDDSEAQFALTQYSQRLWNELQPELPAEAEFDACGTIWVAADEEEQQAVRRKRRFYEDRGVRAHLLDAQALAEAEPNLRPGLAGGLLAPDDRVIYAPCASQWLLDQARRRGASLVMGKRAVTLKDGGVELSGGSSISAGAVVNAAGSEAGKLTPGIEVRPRKGHLAITDRYPGFVRHQLIELGYLKSAHSGEADSVAFNVQPRTTGQALIGSSRQFGQDSSEVEMPVLSRMLKRATTYMPGLADLSVVRTWTGFRAAPSGGLPLIGPYGGTKNVYLAAGHEGLGITTSLATARLLTDILMGRTPPIPVEPYLPARFDSGV